MSKIVQAVNVMIANPSLISNVLKGDREIFFLYKNRYKWSMDRRDDGHHLWYYPGDDDLEYLVGAEIVGGPFEGISMVHYYDGEIGTKEAKASFAELYNVISEKVYGVDKVLDDIISDGEWS